MSDIPQKGPGKRPPQPKPPQPKPAPKPTPRPDRRKGPQRPIPEHVEPEKPWPRK